MALLLRSPTLTPRSFSRYTSSQAVPHRSCASPLLAFFCSPAKLDLLAVMTRYLVPPDAQNTPGDDMVEVYYDHACGLAPVVLNRAPGIAQHVTLKHDRWVQHSTAAAVCQPFSGADTAWPAGPGWCTTGGVLGVQPPSPPTPPTPNKPK